MESSKSKSFVFVACLALILALSTARSLETHHRRHHHHNRHHHHHGHHHHSHGHGHQKAHNFSALYAFGDSLVDTGNNNNNLLTTYRSNHAPYGQDLSDHVSTGRSSNGKLIVDFLVSSLGLKDTLPAYSDGSQFYDDEVLTGVSFGSAGAGLDDQTSQLKFVPTMDQQADKFEQAVVSMMLREGEQGTMQIVKDALFVVSVGTSDMSDNYYGPVALRKAQMDVRAYHDDLLTRLSYFLQRLYGIGARNFVVLGMPPIGCLPSQIFSPSNIANAVEGERECIVDKNMETEEYNLKLQDLISTINDQLSGIKVEYADIYRPIMDMVDRSYIYGIERTTEGCCGGGIPLPIPLVGTGCVEGSLKCQNPDRYLFWDAINPTQVVNARLAQMIEKEVIPKFR